LSRADLDGIVDHMATGTIDPARQLRAVRRARMLSQRELAAAAGVALSTVSAIEAGRRVPGLALYQRILAGVGFGLDVVDGAEPARQHLGLRVDDEHDDIRDRRGRRFPAHLRWGDKPDYALGPYWWGWSRIAWYDSADPAVPDHVYWQRPRPQPSRLGRPPRHHPFWG
jgi:transcriptional regulator with XRE-family HTH domain